MQDSKRDTDVQNSLLDSVGEGEGGMIWENGIETCIISYVKRIASPGLMHDTGCSGLVHWDDPGGWYGEGGGSGVQDGEHMYTRGRFMLMYDQTNIILKINQPPIKINEFILKKVQNGEDILFRTIEGIKLKWTSGKSLNVEYF